MRARQEVRQHPLLCTDQPCLVVYFRRHPWRPADGISGVRACPVRPAGLPIAIATGGSKPQVAKSLSAVGLLEGFFDAIVTANDITPGNGKPHPETFLRAAELIGVDPKFCVGWVAAAPASLPCSCM